MLAANNQRLMFAKNEMSIYKAMHALKAKVPSSVEDARRFLALFPVSIQEQLIAAIYLGREHMHSRELRVDKDIEISCACTSHIRHDEYANIIWEKGVNVITYLDKIEECARASGFDLRYL